MLVGNVKALGRIVNNDLYRMQKRDKKVQK